MVWLIIVLVLSFVSVPILDYSWDYEVINILLGPVFVGLVLYMAGSFIISE